MTAWGPWGVVEEPPYLGKLEGWELLGGVGGMIGLRVEPLTVSGKMGYTM